MTYKLLIVDDSKLARMAVVKALNSCYPDWQRVEAGSAADALSAMEHDAPDIALVDFNMPTRDGLHLAARSAQAQSANADRDHFRKPSAGGHRSRGGVGSDLPAEAALRKRVARVLERGGARLAGRGAVNGTADVILSDLELDAITELVNLGVSRAATNLARMVQEEVILTVPKVALMSRSEAIRTLGERESQSLVAVHQVFEGEITGRALLIFPEERSLELVRAVVGSELSLEELIELEQEALAETGNIILNSCLATIANSLESNLKISLPEVLRGESSRFFNLEPPPAAGTTVMFIYINFAMQRRDINGYLAMMMDMPSLAAMQTLLRALIRRTGARPG